MKNNALIGWIEKRIKQNKNCIIIINGATGSGKTYAGLDLCLTLSNRNNNNFNVNNNLDFSFIGLKKKMNRPENTKPGTCFLFEEVGVAGGGASSREWQTKANAFFFSFMQTARHRNQIFIMTCPQFAYLEKGVRQMIHLQISMLCINPQIKKSFGKPFITQTNAMTGKIYFKYLRYKLKDRIGRTKLMRIRFDLPPQSVINEYEKLKLEYTKSLDKAILSEEKTLKTIGNFKADPEIIQFFLAKKYTNKKIADKLGVSVRTIQRYKNTPQTQT